MTKSQSYIILGLLPGLVSQLGWELFFSPMLGVIGSSFTSDGSSLTGKSGSEEWAVDSLSRTHAAGNERFRAELHLDDWQRGWNGGNTRTTSRISLTAGWEMFFSPMLGVKGSSFTSDGTSLTGEWIGVLRGRSSGRSRKRCCSGKHFSLNRWLKRKWGSERGNQLIGSPNLKVYPCYSGGACPRSNSERLLQRGLRKH